MKTQAHISWIAGTPLNIETVELQGPKFGESIRTVEEF
jgi:Zn-dependent alcohol dehydrogenase